METRWMYHTSATFPQLLEESKGTCMIMIGCVEKHGLHLPLGTDTLVGSRIAYMASQIETVAVFPDYIFGDEPPAIPGHQNPGNVTLLFVLVHVYLPLMPMLLLSDFLLHEWKLHPALLHRYLSYNEKGYSLRRPLEHFL